MTQSGLGPGHTGSWEIVSDFDSSTGLLTGPLMINITGSFYVWSAVTSADSTVYEYTYGPGPATIEMPIPTEAVRVVPDGEGGYSYSPLDTWMAEALTAPKPGTTVIGP